MSVGIRVQCDGRDLECPNGEVVARASTPDQARATVARWGWLNVGDDDYCPTCKLLGSAAGHTPDAGLTRSTACDDGNHTHCHTPTCHCTCHRKGTR
jgi:hypothetical protein